LREKRDQLYEERKYSIFVKNIPPQRMLMAEVWAWFSQYGQVSKLEKFESKYAFAVHFADS